MGSVIFFLTLPLAFRTTPRLPKVLGERELPAAFNKRVLAGGVKFLRFIEKLASPRQTQWLSWPVPHFLNCVLLALLALALALPLPSPPFFFSNSLPSYAIIVLAASMMEEDGLLIWAGYAAVAANVVFFSLIGGVIFRLLLNVWRGFVHYAGGI
jgi:hypothetical protein